MFCGVLTVCGGLGSLFVGFTKIVRMPPRDRTGKRPRQGTSHQEAPIFDPTAPYMGLTQLNPSQKAIWRNLNARKIQVTNFLDVPTLERLGLAHLVRELMTTAGVGNFLGKAEATYRRYTLEFLATLERVEEEDFQGIRCRIDDVQRRLSYDDLREIFGVSEPVGRWLEDDGMVSIFFADLTGKPLMKKFMKAHTLSHPAWKLFYRGLSMTFFGNGEPSQMSQSMVAMMRTAMPNCNVIPDWIGYFIRKCEGIALAKSGNISVGGMITFIVRFLIGEPSDVAIKEGGPGLYEMEWLQKYDRFGRSGDPRERLNAFFEHVKGANAFRCVPGSPFPWGRTALDMRMPGVGEVLRGNENEEPEGRNDEMGDPEGEGHQQGQGHQGYYQQGGGAGAFGQWDEMRAYMDAQNLENQRIQRENFDLMTASIQSLASSVQSLSQSTQYQYGEMYDRVEGIEDTLASHGARFSQLEMWAGQSEPRHFEPVSEEFRANMESRAEVRRQRQSARRSRHDGSSSSFH